MVGEIYLANIYFTDASAAKVRPVLLLKHNSFGDMLYIPLTSNTYTRGVKVDNNDLQEGFLPKSSVVVYEKPGIIAPDLLIKKIGTLKPEICNNILSEPVSFLQS